MIKKTRYRHKILSIIRSRISNKLTHFSLHNHSSFYTVSIQTLQSLIYTPYSSFPIPSCWEAGWWLSYSYLSFLPLWESHNIQMFRNVVFLRLGKTQGHLMSQNKFCGTMAQSSLNPIKPGQIGSLWIFWAVTLCSVASNNILRSTLAPSDRLS